MFTISSLLLALVFDTTGDRQQIMTSRRGLDRFVNTLPPHIQLMVLTINDGICWR